MVPSAGSASRRAARNASPSRTSSMLAWYSVSVVISSCGSGSPESLAEDYYDAVFSGTGEAVWDAVNMDAYLDLSIESGELDEDEADDVKDEAIDNFDILCELYQDSCEEQYGKDWDYEVEVTKVKDLKNSDLRSFENSINGDDSDLEVTEGVAVTVKVTVTGDEDDDFQKQTIYFYKVDGEWIMDPNSMF